MGRQLESIKNVHRLIIDRENFILCLLILLNVGTNLANSAIDFRRSSPQKFIAPRLQHYEIFKNNFYFFNQLNIFV